MIRKDSKGFRMMGLKGKGKGKGKWKVKGKMENE